MRFSEVVGHAELKEDLINEINQDKISHAQLFIGKSGYGVLPLALSFVQYLFCENRQKKDSCGECQGCKKVGKLQHPDLHFSFPTVQPISKTSDGLISEWREMISENPYFDLNGWIKFMDPKERKPIIGKDESQEVIKKLNLRSFEGGYKVMMIWMAEEMNQASANKLLKILEEPPGSTLFILMAESEDMMLQTILSRTQKVRVPRIKMDDLSAHLRTHKKQSSSNADSIASRVDGDLIEALEFLGNHAEQDENRERFIQLMRVCYKKNVLDMMDWSEGISQKSREFQKVFLKYALHMFRQSLLKNYTEETLIRVSDEEADFLDKFARFITGNNIGNFLETFSDAHYHIERNANPKILFTQLCFEVMRYIHKA
ncbi:MAG: DNA polymerase III subunit delta [Crocinitomicaceae bacterium]|nr:DNA polymerase III subunit delta' [Flavobacteriales bacterium]NQZ37144.1 DNA polymerase III subunit delta [Crocinitomicaceae bacterium]